MRIKISQPGRDIIITSTFVSEPLKDSLFFWSQKMQKSFDIRFAPYNQVFQQLTDSHSMISNNKNGYNIILLRFEDWVKWPSYSSSAYEKLIRNIRLFSEGIETAVKYSTAPFLVFICPFSDWLSPKAKEALEKAEKNLISEVKHLPTVSVINSQDLFKYCSTLKYYDRLFDPIAEELGHVVYSQHFYSALGTFICRKVHSIEHPPFKVIVLDCDNTLWKGVCGEDGITGIKITENYKFLQQFFLNQLNAGMLLCLCSKNQEEDVLEVFAKHPDMILKLEHIAAHQINWDPKASNMLKLSKELGLGLDSFIFVDDSPIECEAVKKLHPQVLTLLLPPEPDITSFLQHIWFFDHHRITDEDKTRSLLYKQNAEREKFRSSKLTYKQFLEELDLKVNIINLNESHVARASQLTQRTNQFNCTTIRRSEADILSLLNSKNYDLRIITVSDRFGDYGLVGVLILKIKERAIISSDLKETKDSNHGLDQDELENIASVVVDTFLLSCRVLGRGVEYRIAAWLANFSAQLKLEQVIFIYQQTKKNKPAKLFLDELNSILSKESVIIHDSKNDRDLYYFKNKPLLEVKPSAEIVPYIEPLLQEESKVVSGVDKLSSTLLEVDRNLVELTTRCNDIFKINDEIFKILQKRRDLMELKRPDPANNEIEKVIIEIWRKVLRIDNVGVSDKYLELGGDSLASVIIVSMIYHSLKVKLDVTDLLANPTVLELALKIKKYKEYPIEEAKFEKSGNKGELFPLSFAQKRIWFLHQFHAEKSVYNISIAFDMQGMLNLINLKKSLIELVERHASLRMRITIIDDEPMQKIVKLQEAPLFEKNINKSSSLASEINAVIQEERLKPFDLYNEFLFRICLLQINEEHHVLILIFHHIIADEHSLDIFTTELNEIYNSKFTQKIPQLDMLKTEYIDFTARQYNQFNSGLWCDQLKFWERHLTGAPTLTNLPVDKPRPSIQTNRGSVYTLDLEIGLYKQLVSIATSSNATSFAILLTIFYVLLYQITQEEDIVIGLPFANRHYLGVENIFGMFVNSLALRIKIEPSSSFKTLLELVRNNLLEAHKNQDIPFESVVDQLKVSRTTNYHPLFQTMFVMRNNKNLKLDGIKAKIIEHDSTTAMFDLMLIVEEKDHGLKLSFEYATDLFERETIIRLAERYKQLVTDIIQESKQSVCSLMSLTKTESELVKRVNSTEYKFYSEKTIHQLFDERVLKSGNSPAICFPGFNIAVKIPEGKVEYKIQLNEWHTKCRMGDILFISEAKTDLWKAYLVVGDSKIINKDISESPYITSILKSKECSLIENELKLSKQALEPHITKLFDNQIIFKSLTYKQLSKQVNVLANYLITDFQIEPDSLIAVCMEPCLALIITIIAILKAGGAYLPLDTNFPEERLNYILSDASYPILITTKDQSKLFKDYKGKLISLDDETLSLLSKRHSVMKPVQSGKSDQLAYVIYTSGSTGQPKGVMIEHKSVLNLINYQTRLFEINDTTKVLQLAPINFDISIWEWAATLVSGGTLCLIPNKMKHSIETLINVCNSMKINMLMITPSLLNVFPDVELPYLKSLFVAGEVCPEVTLKKWNKKHIKLYNAYGPTETTVISTIHHYDEKLPAQTIGRPIDNTQIFILNESHYQVPIGTVGELYIGGVGLARGYLNKKELTAERFITVKINNGVSYYRLYKTGDLARYLKDGSIEFIGRRDNQIKLRGYRIELGEIEAALSSQPEIRSAAVLLKQLKSGEKGLVAYIVPMKFEIPDLKELLISRLKNILPQYMLPALYIELSEMPLNSNGKIDRNHLYKRIDSDLSIDSDVAHIVPEDPVEFELYKIYQDILKVRINLVENFFNMGGNSLQIIVLLHKINLAFNLKLTVDLIFKDITIKNLAKTIRKLQSEEVLTKLGISNLVGLTNITPIQTKGSRPPLFIIHPSFGLATPYKVLSNYIVDRPVFGISDPDFYQPNSRFNALEEMATFYLNAIQSLQIEGPIYLAGWSFGGVVALEIAQQLKKMDKKVDSVILIDTYNYYNQNLNIDDSGEILLTNQKIEPSSEEGQILKNEIAKNLSLLKKYRLVEYEGHVVLLKACNPQNKDKIEFLPIPAISDQPQFNYDISIFNGWINSIKPALINYSVIGEHEQLFKPENVALIAQRITYALNNPIISPILTRKNLLMPSCYLLHAAANNDYILFKMLIIAFKCNEEVYTAADDYLGRTSFDWFKFNNYQTSDEDIKAKMGAPLSLKITHKPATSFDGKDDQIIRLFSDRVLKNFMRLNRLIEGFDPIHHNQNPEILWLIMMKIMIEEIKQKQFDDEKLHKYLDLYKTRLCKEAEQIWCNDKNEEEAWKKHKDTKEYREGLSEYIKVEKEKADSKLYFPILASVSDYFSYFDQKQEEQNYDEKRKKKDLPMLKNNFVEKYCSDEIQKIKILLCKDNEEKDANSLYKFANFLDDSEAFDEADFIYTEFLRKYLKMDFDKLRNHCMELLLKLNSELGFSKISNLSHHREKTSFTTRPSSVQLVGTVFPLSEESKSRAAPKIQVESSDPNSVGMGLYT